MTLTRRLWYGTLVATLAMVAAALQPAAAASGTRPAAGSSEAWVDLELVLAVDVSYSMDTEEQALQRDGYVAAITSPEFLEALRAGPQGRIAIAYVEWAGENEQDVVVNWRIVDGPESARAFANAVAAAPIRRVYRTSISGALLYSADQFDANGYHGLRKVIDISGDGVNNQGLPVETARESVVQRGITVNGLPLLLKRGSASAIDVPELDIYYEDCVIGGPGAFMIPVEQMSEFARAIKTKLVMEVAGLVPRPAPATARIVPVAAAQKRISCTIGEKIWQDHWAN